MELRYFSKITTLLIVFAIASMSGYAQLTPSFYYTDTCTSGPTYFNDNSTPAGSIKAWSWNFGDGSELDTNQFPAHQYGSAGSYNVVLTVTDTADAVDQVQMNVEIAECPPVLHANVAGMTEPCVGKLESYDNISWTEGGAYIHLWSLMVIDDAAAVVQDYYYTDTDYQDSLQFDSIGSFVLRIMVEDTIQGLIDSMDLAINVTDCGGGQLKAMFDHSTVSCINDTVFFNDVSTPGDTIITDWNWDFGDGNTATGSNVSHVYVAGGTYYPTLVITDANGLTDTADVPGGLFMDSCGGFNVDFWSDYHCLNDSTVFTSNILSGGVAPFSYSWTFGDGNGSSIGSPVHQFADTGYYNVDLLVVDNVGDSAFFSQSVGIMECFFDAFINWDGSCINDTIGFSGQATDSVVTWSWDFGDGNTAVVQNPYHSYSATGEYNVALTAVNVAGDSAYSSQIMNVDSCNFNASVCVQPAACPGDTVMINNCGQGNIVSTLWTYSDGHPSDTMWNTSRPFNTEGNFDIFLEVINDKGDTAFAQFNINIDSANCGGSMPANFWTDFRCLGDTTQFHSDGTDSSATITWSFGDGNTGAGKDASNEYLAAGNYDVYMIVSDTTGVDSIYQSVFIDGACGGGMSPTFSWGMACLTDTTFFQTEYVDSTDAVTWTFGDGGNSAGHFTPHLFTQAGDVDVWMILNGADTIHQLVFVDSVCHQTGPGGFWVDFTCFGDTAQFHSDSLPDGATVTWNFGDGEAGVGTDPWHVYASPGNYDVSMMVTDSMGSDTITSNVFIDDNCGGGGSGASFWADFTCLGDTTQFHADSIPPGATVTWAFGDGGTANGNDVSHSYDAAGDYSVMMVLSDSTDSDTIMNMVHIDGNCSQGSPSFWWDMSCTGDTTQFHADNTDATDAIAWFFGDGGEAQGKDAANQYAGPGDYSVLLVVTDTSGVIDSVMNNVMIEDCQGTGPHFDWTDACFETATHFWISGVDSTDNVNWEFEDGGSANGHDILYQFTQWGDLGVYAIVNGTDTIGEVVYIEEFCGGGGMHIEAIGLCNTDTTMLWVNGVDMMDSTLTVDWNFGDGNVGVGPNTAHLYADTGIVNVSAIVTHANGVDSLDNTFYIYEECTMAPEPIDIQNACLTDTTWFSTGVGADSVQWNLGDGTVLAGFGVGHQYADTGEYYVQMHYWNSGEENMHDAYVIITDECSNGGDVNIMPTHNCVMDTILWSLDGDIGTDPNGFTWEWDFGNGQTMTGYPGQSLYNDTGEFMVTVIIHVPGEQIDTNVFSFYVMDCSGQGNGPQFNWDSTCVGTATTITLDSPNAADLAWVWDFGNGQTSTSYPGTVVYDAAGEYTVSAWASDSTETDSAEFVIFINDCTPIDTVPEFVADFMWSGDCLEDTVWFFGPEVDSMVTAVNWTFSDGSTDTGSDVPHNFAVAGDYDVNMTVTLSDGSSHEANKVIYLDSCEKWQPEPYLTVFGGCLGDSSFAQVGNVPPGDHTVSWDMGDGTVINNDQAGVTYLYGDTGVYTITMTATDSIGDKVLTEQVHIADCGNEIFVDFFFNGDCAKEPFTFETYSNAIDEIAYVNWSFGDGGVGTGLNSQHVYDAAGFYTVFVDYGDFNGGVATDTLEIYVDPCFEDGAADFVYNGGGCPGEAIAFFDSSSFSAIVEHNWQFGDGTSSFQQNPSHVFANAGDYGVTLIVLTAKGQVDSVTYSVMVDDCYYGEAAFDWDGNCMDSVYTFTDLSDIAVDTLSTWTWDFAGEASATGQTATHSFSAAGSYDVTLSVTNGAGVSDAITHTILVADCDTGSVVLNVTGVDASCFGATDGSVKAIAAGSPPLAYAWATGEVTAAVSNLGAGTYTVTVTASNGKVATQSYVISSPDEVDATITATALEVCAGETITLNAAAGYASYDWTTGDATESTTVDQSGTYSLIVSDANGCTDASSITVDVHGIQQVLVSAKPSVCIGDTSMMIASGVKKYLWSGGLGINDTVINTPSQTRLYTVIGTDVNGCKSTASVTVAVNALPVVSFTYNHAECGQASGVATAVVTNGTAPYTYAWENGSDSSSITGVEAGSYKLLVVDSNGCRKNKLAAIADLSGPTVVVTPGAGSNCGGPDGTATSTVTGGQPPYNYLWSNGWTGTSLAKVKAGDYALKVTDSGNCKGGDALEIDKVGDNPPSIIGHITSSANGWNIQGGNLFVVRNHHGKGRLDTVARAAIDSVGDFSINSILPIGDYIVIASPDTTIPGQGYQIPSYFQISGDTISTTHKWLEATPYGASCDSMLEVDIKIIDLQPLDGTSDVSGALFLEDTTLIGKNSGILGEPIPGINVSLEQVPGGIVAQTTSDEDGHYQFDNVPEGDYTIHVDIPGLEMEQTYDVELESADTSVAELDFLITEEVITIEQKVSVTEFEGVSSKVAMYPNPFQQTAYISYSLDKSDDVQIQVYNILGEQVMNNVKQSVMPGSHVFTLNTNDIVGSETGIFIVKIAIGNDVYSARMISVE